MNSSNKLWLLATLATCGAVACSGPAANRPHPVPVKLSAAQVFERMAQAYRALHSYEDRGVHYTYWPNKKLPDELLFNTSFERPDRFRFDFVGHHPYPPLRHKKWRTSLVSAGNKSFMRRIRGGGWAEMTSLRMAVAAATGTSRGTAYRVSTLLALPGNGARRSWLARIKGPMVQGQRVFEGTRCIVIAGQFRGDRVTLWIGADDFLLRRYQQVAGPSSFKPGLRSEQIVRGIRRNHRVVAARFELPPVSERHKDASLRPTSLPSAKVSALLTALRTSSSVAARVSAVLELGRDTDPRVTSAFVDLLADADSSLRIIAASKLLIRLGTLTDKALRDKAIALLRTMATSDANPNARYMAKRTLRRLGERAPAVSGKHAPAVSGKQPPTTP